jgi:hypothetical protein
MLSADQSLIGASADGGMSGRLRTARSRHAVFGLRVYSGPRTGGST